VRLGHRDSRVEAEAEAEAEAGDGDSGDSGAEADACPRERPTKEARP
jgi:hypothetical protein